MSHHPTEHLLAEYSAGSLAAGPALCVSIHLDSCHECRHRNEDFNLLGAAMLEQSDSVECSTDLFSRVMNSVESTSEGVIKASSAGAKSALTALLPKGLGVVDWKKRGQGVSTYDLPVSEEGFTVKLLRVAQGRKVFQHTHTGSEFTVLLQGGYSDTLGNFVAGDFVECDASHVHQPVAHQDQDCVLLTAVSGDLKFTGPFARMLNPFFAF